LVLRLQHSKPRDRRNDHGDTERDEKQDVKREHAEEVVCDA
jgi:hypothetical protein